MKRSENPNSAMFKYLKIAKGETKEERTKRREKDDPTLGDFDALPESSIAAEPQEENHNGMEEENQN